ncbi:MAG: hypothetical protein IPN67_04960 [Bacteroidales bacterium]|nr:hypothetical protein [Bacteroidales bacterium]
MAIGNQYYKIIKAAPGSSAGLPRFFAPKGDGAEEEPMMRSKELVEKKRWMADQVF